MLLYEPPFATGADRIPADLADRLSALLQAGDWEAVITTFLREGPRRAPEEIAQLRAQPDWAERLALAPTLPRELRVINEYTFAALRFAGVQVPILLLLGSASPPFFHETTHTLLAALAQSEVAVLAGQTHNAMDTAPALLAETTLRFMGRQPAADR